MSTGRIKAAKIPAAVIPAAGLSSRMKDFKPLLSLGNTTLLGRVISIFQKNGIEDIIVVLGHRHRDLVPLIESAGARWCVNPDYRSGMFSSILTGINALDDTCNAFFLLPADIPALRSQTVRQLKEAFLARQPEIVYPVFDRQRGHPPVISTRLVKKITSFDGRGGLRACLEKFEAGAVDISVPDRGILMDADTPENYRAIVDKFFRRHLPEPEECRTLLNHCQQMTPAIKAHCMAVERLVSTLAEMITPHLCLNMERLKAAALLHDIARKQPHHGPAGAALLHAVGFDGITPLVASHMDIHVDPHAPLTESELLFFADKLVQETQVNMDFTTRFRKKRQQFSNKRQALEAIDRRLAAMEMIRTKIDKILNNSFSDIMKELKKQGIK